MDFSIIALQRMCVYPLLRILSWIIVGLMAITPALAQDNTVTISAENIGQLASFAGIEFDTFSAAVGGMDLGWFALSQMGDRLAVRDRNNDLVILDMQGTILDRYFVPGTDGLPATVIDADFDAEGGVLVSVHLDGVGYDVAYRQIETQTVQYFRFETGHYPLRIWVDRGNTVWLEISPADSGEQRSIIQLSPEVTERFQSGDVLPEEEITSLPSGPENDPDAFLRIGRIKPPMAITVTQQGLVKRWNLEMDAPTATVELVSLPGAGQVNASGRYFIWRDAESTSLFLLDFETGENRLIAPLNGTYIPFLLLSVNAEVAIGVDVGSEPTVVAWDTMTGERYNLGEYRTCNHQPDMVRLSHDGTTLVIGCDTGLDIWCITGDVG